MFSCLSFCVYLDYIFCCRAYALAPKSGGGVAELSRQHSQIGPVAPKIKKVYVVEEWPFGGNQSYREENDVVFKPIKENVQKESTILFDIEN